MNGAAFPAPLWAGFFFAHGIAGFIRSFVASMAI